MTAMDHAAAHERIEDLLLEPARLSALPRSMDPADAGLREHVAGCPVCLADLETWEQLQRQLATALPASREAAADAVEPIGLPPSLRARVVAAVREPDPAVQIPAGTAAQAIRPRRAIAGWLALAASIVLVVGLGAATIDQASRRATAEADARALSGALAAVDRVLAAPDRRAVQLLSAAGVPSGSISWSSNDLVVLTTALSAPPDDQEYLCWLMEPGGGSVIGKMYFAGRTAYWIGSLDEWATFRIGPDTRFSVRLSPIDRTRPSGPEVLSADLGD